jgi:predicted GIY-YIG superfamily endonuclease
VEQRENGNACEISSRSHDVQTVEDALKKANIDDAIWTVDRCVINSWEVAAKVKDASGEKLETRPLWQVKVWLKRRIAKVFTDVADALVERMAKHAPRYKTPKYLKSKAPRHCLEISLNDVHFGKLAWQRETGEDYDVEITETVYQNAVVDLVAHAERYRLDRILFPVGSDFFHVNNADSTTRAGTLQDVDGRWAKVFEAGCAAVINAIDYCREHAPVDVFYVPGNHDFDTAWHLALYLKAWYRHDKAVIVDAEPTSRKYRSYGVNLIGFTHGNEEKHADLPTIMASEVPEQWAAAQVREWHLGHYHKVKETRHVTADTFGSVRVRVLPSLSGTDAWHYRKGYVGNMRAAEAYLWAFEHGYVGHFSATARRN